MMKKKTVIKSQLCEFIYPECSVTNSCHASTVLPLPNGNVVAAWFGGTKEGARDVKIWVSVRENECWCVPYKVEVSGEAAPHWNPALFLREDGTVCLYFKYGKKIREWVTYFSLSTDGGKSFSTPEVLIKGDADGGRGPVKNKPIRLSDGTVLAPASKESKYGWKCFCDISKDDGKTFTHSNFVVRPKKDFRPVNMIQPTLWEDENGVHMLVRTNVGKIYRSDSTDSGVHWCKAYETPYLNPNSGIDLTELSDGSLVLIMNPVGKNWGDRAPLVLERSFDGGNTFSEFIKLEKTTGDHEFSYPAIVADGNTIYITYTYERKTIAFWKIEIEE